MWVFFFVSGKEGDADERECRIIWGSCGRCLTSCYRIFSTILSRSRNGQSLLPLRLTLLLPYPPPSLPSSSPSPLSSLPIFVSPLLKLTRAHTPRFNLPTLQSTISTSRSTQIISKLHTILKPFLLRRLKVDVETNLPPKKEYVLYAPLTTRQREAYQEILDGGVRGYLLRQMNQKTKADGKAKHLELEGGVDSVDVDKLRTLRKKKVGEEGKYRILDGDDDAYFEHLEKRGEEEWAVVPEVEQEEVGKEYRRKTASMCFSLLHSPALGSFSLFPSPPLVKQINNMRLQNTVMQLRKVCSHPFLFELPDEAHFQQTDAEGTSGENLVNASGKMMVLERLLDELKKRDHRVLIFSQFTSMLDIIEVRSPPRTFLPSLPLPFCQRHQLDANATMLLGLGYRRQGLVYLPHRRQDTAPRAARPDEALPGRE